MTRITLRFASVLSTSQRDGTALGYDTYADYVMKYRMATSVENVYKLLNDLIKAYKPTAIEERNEVIALAKEMEGNDFKVMPWDVAYYSHQLKMRKYDLDPEMLRPYLELNNVNQRGLRTGYTLVWYHLTRRTKTSRSIPS